MFSNAFNAIRRDLALEIPFIDSIPVSEDEAWAHQALAAGYSIAYEPMAEALHAHRYTPKGVFRRTYPVGKALQSAGLGQGATFAESMQFLATELRYFIRQGHAHRLPQLLAYEFIRWAGYQAGRRTAAS